MLSWLALLQPKDRVGHSSGPHNLLRMQLPGLLKRRCGRDIFIKSGDQSLMFSLMQQGLL